MREVLCWCCEHFTLSDNELSEFFKKSATGICCLTGLEIPVYNRVCENFIINKGLHTKRTIPKYCRNYQ